MNCWQYGVDYPRTLRLQHYVIIYPAPLYSITDKYGAQPVIPYRLTLDYMIIKSHYVNYRVGMPAPKMTT